MGNLIKRSINKKKSYVLTYSYREKNMPKKEAEKKERRVFLKKALYSAPILVTLGSLTPTYVEGASSVSAGSFSPPPPPENQ